MTRPAAPRFDWLRGDVADLRRDYERCFAMAGAWSWQTVDGGPRLLVQRPPGGADPAGAILYVHGGGWIVGSPLTHADISGALSGRTGMIVYSLDYRLAPEHRAPAPVLDGCRALSALVQDGNIGDVFLCGDSAGAAIALAIERRADAALRERILGVGAFYGCYGLGDTPSLREFGARADGTDAACIARFWSLAHDEGAPSPYAVEALAHPAGAPVYLLAAGNDPLRDDSLALAAAYRRCGRPHHLDLVPCASHGFLHAPDTSPAAAAIDRIGAWILSQCASPPAPHRPV